MKVIVIGAGMGGLSAGLALQQIGCEVEIYEQVTENRPVGAAITLWSNGVKCLNYLGLRDQIAALGGRVDYLSYRDGRTGATMTRFSLEPVTRLTGQRPYPVSRAELQLLLMREFGDDGIRFGQRMTGIEDDGTKVTATFADGTTATGDLLIGADGARSLTREYVLGGPADRRYAGYVTWNGLVPVCPEVGPPDQWTTYVAEGKRVSVMPVAGDRFYFFLDVPLPPEAAGAPGAALPPDERAGTREALHGHFAGWTAPVHTLIELLDPAATNRVGIWDLDPFHTWARGRVALLGDAAHTTAPDIGQGGCAAMEDAVALQIALRTNTLGAEDALQRYQRRRSERAAELVRRARKRSDVTHGRDWAVTQAWYDQLRAEDGSGIIRGIVATIEGSLLG